MVDGWSEDAFGLGDGPGSAGAGAWGPAVPSPPAEWDDVLDGWGAVPELTAEDDAVLRELAVQMDREPMLVVPDHGDEYQVIRDPAGGWVRTVAGAPPGAGLAAALAEADLVAASDLELGEVAAGLARLMSWARARQAAAVTELSSRASMQPKPSGKPYRSVSARSCTALELTDPLKLTAGQAEQLVAESTQLVTDFPRTHAALAAGRIDERRARVILSELGRQDRDVAVTVEAAVIDRAEQLNSRQLRRRIAYLVCKLAPVAAKERRDRAEKDRYVRTSPAADGMAWIEALVRAEDAAAIDAVLDAGQKTLKRHDAATGNPNARTADQRRADVLAMLAWSALTNGHIGGPHPAGPDGGADTSSDGAGTGSDSASTDQPGADDDGDRAGSSDGNGNGDHTGATDTRRGNTDPVGDDNTAAADAAVAVRCAPPGMTGPLTLSSAHGRPVTAHITVPLTTALGLNDEPGHLAGYGPVPAHVARLLTASGLWQWIGTDPVTGATLAHGRTRYVPTRDLVDHIILRDHTCKTMGCAVPAERADIDHTIAHPNGPTDADNLGPFCRRHHLTKHHTYFQLDQPHPGTFIWTTPTGRRITIPPSRTGSVPEPGPEPPGRPPPLPDGEPPPSPDDEPPL